MRYLLKIAIILGASQISLSHATDYSVKKTSGSPVNLPTATVVIAPTNTRSKPNFQAPTLYVLKLDDKVTLFAQTTRWYGIRMQTMQGDVLESWIEKSAVRVDAEQMEVVTNITQPLSKTDNPSKEKTNTYQLGILTAPTFDVHKFGANQRRVGLFYTQKLNPWLALDIPASYTYGEGFESLQTGVGVLFTLWNHGERWLIFSRNSLMAERFFNDSKHFYSLTVDVGFGVRWMMMRHIGISLEPLSAEAMVYNTESIPINVRAQGIVRLMYSW